MTMARYEPSGLWGDYGYDEEQGCWWASDKRGRQYRFVVERLRPLTLRREVSLLRGLVSPAVLASPRAAYRTRRSPEHLLAPAATHIRTRFPTVGRVLGEV
jgi:hypothetical protein